MKEKGSKLLFEMRLTIEFFKTPNIRIEMGLISKKENFNWYKLIDELLGILITMVTLISIMSRL